MVVMLKEMFSRLTPNSERALAERVQREGGIDTVQNNDQLLRTLLQTSPANAQERGVSSAPGRGGQKNAPKRSAKPRETYTLSDLKEELRENQDDGSSHGLGTRGGGTLYTALYASSRGDGASGATEKQQACWGAPPCVEPDRRAQIRSTAS